MLRNSVLFSEPIPEFEGSNACANPQRTPGLTRSINTSWPRLCEAEGGSDSFELVISRLFWTDQRTLREALRSASLGLSITRDQAAELRPVLEKIRRIESGTEARLSGPEVFRGVLVGNFEFVPIRYYAKGPGFVTRYFNLDGIAAPVVPQSTAELTESRGACGKLIELVVAIIRAAEESRGDPSPERASLTLAGRDVRSDIVRRLGYSCGPPPPSTEPFQGQLLPSQLFTIHHPGEPHWNSHCRPTQSQIAAEMGDAEDVP